MPCFNLMCSFNKIETKSFQNNGFKVQQEMRSLQWSLCCESRRKPQRGSESPIRIQVTGHNVTNSSYYKQNLKTKQNRSPVTNLLIPVLRSRSRTIFQAQNQPTINWQVQPTWATQLYPVSKNSKLKNFKDYNKPDSLIDSVFSNCFLFSDCINISSVFSLEFLRTGTLSK